MSRRITLFALAASAALIATQASADPECFGETCRMPEVVEPPVADLPDAHDAAAAEASAAPSKFVPPKALPQVIADPVMWPPVPMQSLADDARAPRRVKSLPEPMRAPTVATPAPILETSAAPAGYVRSARVSSPDSGYVVGYNAAVAGGIVVVVPGAVYGSGRYMIAPSAKIISIDSDD